MHKHLRFRLALLTLISLFTFGKAQASDDSAGHLGFGIQGGLNFSSLSGADGSTTSKRTGFLLGVLLEIPLAEFIYVSPEVSFVQRGANVANGSIVAVNAYSNSIEVPVFLKVKLLEGIRPYFFAGPDFIFNIGNSMDVTSGNSSLGSISYNPKTFDFALDFGAGLEIGALFANIRYSLGLINVNDNSADWKSRGFQILVGLHF